MRANAAIDQRDQPLKGERMLNAFSQNAFLPMRKISGPHIAGRFRSCYSVP